MAARQGALLYKRSLGLHQGCPGHIAPAGEIINLATYDYGPYGERLDQGRGRGAGAADPGEDGTADAQDKRQGGVQSTLGYAGMYYHARSGLYLTHFRAYDPRLGRWLSRDPIWEGGGINLYGYVRNNPLSDVDPTGLTDYRDELIKYICWLLSNLGNYGVTLGAGIGNGLGIAGSVSINSTGISSAVNGGLGYGLGGNASVQRTINLAQTGADVNIGTSVSIQGGFSGLSGVGRILRPIGGSAGYSGGTGGVSFSGSIGFGFGFAIVAGGNVSGQIIDCSNYNKCKQ